MTMDTQFVLITIALMATGIAGYKTFGDIDSEPLMKWLYLGVSWIGVVLFFYEVAITVHLFLKGLA